MAGSWSRPVGVSDLDGPDYWDYFGIRLVERAACQLGAKVLVGAGLDLPFFQRRREPVQEAMLSALTFALAEYLKPALG